MKHIISLGAGVQSSTMALMAAHGEITPMPDCAIFADTGAEPQNVYDWLDWLEGELPFPVHRVSKDVNLEDEALRVRKHPNGYDYIRGIIPARIKGHGLLGRSCTNDFKLAPLKKKTKELCGIKHRFPKECVVAVWLGISLDEIQRTKLKVDEWQDFRHPLIELRMTRGDCLNWMSRNGYPEPPRSACYFCPFHSNEEWRKLKDESLDDFMKAARFEGELIDKTKKMVEVGHLKGIAYLHRDHVPLLEVDLSTAEDHGQISWLDECAGMCGV